MWEEWKEQEREECKMSLEADRSQACPALDRLFEIWSAFRSQCKHHFHQETFPNSQPKPILLFLWQHPFFFFSFMAFIIVYYHMWIIRRISLSGLKVNQSSVYEHFAQGQKQYVFKKYLLHELTGIPIL